MTGRAVRRTLGRLLALTFLATGGAGPAEAGQSASAASTRPAGPAGTKAQVGAGGSAPTVVPADVALADPGRVRARLAGSVRGREGGTDASPSPPLGHRAGVPAGFDTVAAVSFGAPPDGGTGRAGAASGSGATPGEDDADPFPVTGPLSGYMDFHYNDGEGTDPVLDFHRFVLLFNHSFSERVRFVGELELEHALVEGLEAAGELELEQAYLDFLLMPAFNLRAGMILAPVGIINERHEPPAFHGVERPFVDTVIIPSTWFDAGAGVHGDLGRGVTYRAYVMAPLDATGFSADEGLRGGRQKGFESSARSVAVTGRVEYRAAPGLVLGSSAWRGKTGFATPRFDSRVSLAEVDGRYRRGPVAVRGELAHVWLEGMAELNDAVQRTVGVSPNVARQLRGFYLEGAYQFLPPRLPHELAAFVRYENFDTQFRMPAGLVPLPQFDRAAWVVGATYFPDPDVAVKFDYTVLRNRSEVVDAPDALNVGLGWWF